MILRTEGEQPDLPKALLLAPTGTAAFNIEGITIHSAFLLKIRSSKKKKKQNTTYQPLSDEKRNSLRTKLSALCFIIIDEISMVGSDLILRVHYRLNELFGGQKIFGGISIITFGDMYQIRPVGQRFIFLPPTDRYAALAPSLWNNFKFMELNMIMRQREDKEFAEMLNRIRTASHTEEDLKLLRGCTYEDESTIPADTLHVFPTNAEVDEFNDKMLEELPGPLVTLTAIGKKPAALKNYCLSDNPTYTGGLPTTIKLKKGARIMLIRNIDVTDGLANGSTGKVIDFKYSEHGTVLAVFVKFDNKRVGRNARLQSPFDLSGFGPDVVPITPVEVQFSPNDNNLTVTRKQFPLKLCWASTFHKVQGSTVNRIAISLEKGLRAGQAYVALSRSKTLDGIYVKKFSEKQIKADDDVVLEMKRLAAEQTITKPFDIFESHSVSLATLNARSARLHFNDIKSNPLLRQTDILCIAETNIPQNKAHLYQIPDTHMICLGHSSESNCHGLAFYVKTAIIAEKQTSFHYPFLELLCVTTHSARFLRKNCLVYRSPSTQIGTFIGKLTEYISDQNPDIILGDMNIDIRSTSYKRLINALPSYLQLVDKPTHISGSTLDLAFQRRGCTGVKVNVFPTYFSDHSIVHHVKKVP